MLKLQTPNKASFVIALMMISALIGIISAANLQKPSLVPTMPIEETLSMENGGLSPLNKEPMAQTSQTKLATKNQGDCKFLKFVIKISYFVITARCQSS